MSLFTVRKGFIQRTTPCFISDFECDSAQKSLHKYLSHLWLWLTVKGTVVTFSSCARHSVLHTAPRAVTCVCPSWFFPSCEQKDQWVMTIGRDYCFAPRWSARNLLFWCLMISSDPLSTKVPSCSKTRTIPQIQWLISTLTDYRQSSSDMRRSKSAWWTLDFISVTDFTLDFDRKTTQHSTWGDSHKQWTLI